MRLAMPHIRAPKARRTQEERSASTRARLLDATISCLIDLGYAGTTTTVVAERAGVSRGAQLHHFPAKTDLVISAVEHLAGRRGEELRREAEEILPHAADRVAAAIDLLWSSFKGPLFAAALELWVASRADAGLRARLVPVEQRVGGALKGLCRYLLGVQDESDERVNLAVDLTLHFMRGMALAGVSIHSAARNGELLDAWKKIVAAQVGAVQAGALPGSGAGTAISI